MKNQKYFLNTVLALVFGLVLLAMVLIRTFAPVIILPSASCGMIMWKELKAPRWDIWRVFSWRSNTASRAQPRHC